MGIVLCILTACTGRPSPSTYSNSSATSSDSNVEADNKNTEPTATGFKNLTRPYYSVLGCGGESGYYETRARDDGSANVTYIDYSSQKEIYLCNAPGCAHDNEGCTSWISAENAGVFPLISSDHLLLIHRTYGGEEGKQSLSRIDAASLDGSNRKTLITFNNGERLGDVFCTNGESLICSLTTLEQLPDTLESTFTLCMIDLNTGERVDLYVEDTTDGIQPEFLGVTETGYAVLHSSQQTKTESDFPGKEWSEISDEIARSTFHQWEKIPIGGNCCESFYEYTGNIQQLLMADGLYFYDVNTKKLIRISVQDSNIDEVADFISTDGNSAYIDGKFDEWLLMSIRHYEQHPNVEYPVAIESCYAINTQTKEVKELMKSVGNRCQELRQESEKLDYKWNDKALQVGGETLAEYILPAYRNFLSSHKFVLSPDDKLFCFGDTLGNVREAYKSFPALLFFNRVDWMKSLLDPVFIYCEGIYWNKKHPPYDIGLYPVSGKQVKLESCAVEAAANMLIMTTAIVEAEQDFGYADMHWSQLILWADYLQKRIKKETFPLEGLLGENDECVKCTLGLEAYRRLIQLKEAYE